MWKRYCLIAPLALTFSNSHAQEDTLPKMLDVVLLTAQRQAQKQLLVPYSTQVVTHGDLKKLGPRTTPEALTGINGVFVQKTTHSGGSPFLRGLTGNQTLILVDGIRLNNSTFRYGPNQYLNTIDAYTVDKIEVAKGTGAVQYGSDALGGVIQVFTREPQFAASERRWLGRAEGRYMSGDMEKTIRGEAGYQSKNAAVQLGATYRNFGDLIGGDSTSRQSPSGYKEFAFDVKTKLRLRENSTLTLAHQFLQQQNVPVYYRIRLENFVVNTFDPQQRQLSYAKLNVTSKQPWAHAIQTSVSWQQSRERRHSQKNNSAVLRTEQDCVNTLGFTTDVESRFATGWTVNSGIETYHDQIQSSREDYNTANGAVTPLRGLYPNDSRYGNYSIYSLHHFAFTNWLLDGGVRFNTFGIRIKDSSLGTVTLSPSSFVYNAAIMYKLFRQHYVYATMSTGFRAPNVDDMGTLGIVDFRYELPTANLAPEKSRNWEAGYKMQSRKWAASVSAYYMQLDDLITRIRVANDTINGYPVYKKQNVENGAIKGFEAEAGYELMRGWYLTGNIAYAYGQSTTRNEPLRRIPPLNGRVISRYNSKAFFCCR
jgi:outer membrane cobalamin receptor